jgi:hypothetical protein
MRSLLAPQADSQEITNLKDTFLTVFSEYLLKLKLVNLQLILIFADNLFTLVTKSAKK